MSDLPEDQLGYTADPEPTDDTAKQPDDQVHYGPDPDDLQLPGTEGGDQPSATGEPTDAGKPGEPVTPAQESAEPYFDDQTIAWGRQVGMTEEKVRSFGTVDNALNAIEIIAEMQAGQASQPTPSAPTPAQQPTGKHVSLFDITIDEAEHPGLTNQLKAVNDGVVSVLTEAATLVQQQQQELAAIKTALFEMEFDTAVSELGEEWEKELGKGRMRDLERSAPAYSGRAKLRDRIELERNILARKNGGTMPSISRLARDSLPVVFADRFKAQAREELEKQVEDFRRQSIRPPTHGKRAPRNTAGERERKAAEKVDAWQKEQGVLVGDFGL
jgi:hypothetical protein